MEIEKKTTRTIKFSDLNSGDVFVIEDDSGVYMVVDKDYGLGTAEKYDGYAIDLTSGWHYGFGAWEDVTKVSAKLTITD